MLLRDVLDLDPLATDRVGEVGEVRLGRGQHVVVPSVAQDDAVLNDIAPFVAPDRVLAVPDGTRPDVAGQDSAQEALRIGPVDPVLEERR